MKHWLSSVKARSKAELGGSEKIVSLKIFCEPARYKFFEHFGKGAEKWDGSEVIHRGGVTTLDNRNDFSFFKLGGDHPFNTRIIKYMQDM